MVPAFPEWQAHVLKVVDRLVNQYGADGIFLDSFGWQMNWPMHVDYVGPNGPRYMDCWPADYTQGVLNLADAVRHKIGSDRVVLVETPSGPMGRHCHGGLTDGGERVMERSASSSSRPGRDDADGGDRPDNDRRDHGR